MNSARRALKRAHAKASPDVLAHLSPEDRTRYELLKVGADKTRIIAHQMLDSQLDTILPELLTHIDAGGTFAVLVVNPEQMPVMPEESKLVGLNGKPLGA
jgi:hypothetical protein